MAYKRMDTATYYSITVVFYFSEICLSLLIPGVGPIFDFISVFSISSIVFIFPGLFYLLCEKKYGYISGEEKLKHYMSIIYIVLGVTVAILILINACIELFNL